jgi:hypothetical protein
VLDRVASLVCPCVARFRSPTEQSAGVRGSLVGGSVGFADTGNRRLPVTPRPPAVDTWGRTPVIHGAGRGVPGADAVGGAEIPDQPSGAPIVYQVGGYHDDGSGSRHPGSSSSFSRKGRCANEAHRRARSGRHRCKWTRRRSAGVRDHNRGTRVVILAGRSWKDAAARRPGRLALHGAHRHQQDAREPVGPYSIDGAPADGGSDSGTALDPQWLRVGVPR